MARVLSVIESSVLNLVPQGMDNRRNLKEIASLIDLDVRSIQEIINRLISYGVPICAFRGNNQSGVYIPTNQEELRLGTRAVKSQIKEMMIRVDRVENADLINWKSAVVTTRQSELEV